MGGHGDGCAQTASRCQWAIESLPRGDQVVGVPLDADRIAPRPGMACGGAAAGFRTVDSWWPDGEAECEPWADEVIRNGITVALLNYLPETFARPPAGG